MEFTIKLAEVNIKIISLYDRVFALCKDYLSNKPHDFCVTVTENDIDFERKKALREAKIEGKTYFDFSDSYLETLAVYRKIAVGLLDYDAFLMHGAVVGLDGKAYLFTAPSGVGKTTHVNFWLNTYKNAFVINGDKPLIKFKCGKAYAFGSPWAGKEGLNTNTSLELFAVCSLSRAESNSITQVDFNKMLPLLVAQTYRPSEKLQIEKTMSYIKRLGGCVKFFSLRCNLDKSAATVAFCGMNK